MTVRDLMTTHIAHCPSNALLSDVARLMLDYDCGAIPVLDGDGIPRLTGIVTDRDIVCRVLARGEDPLRLTAADCMSAPVVTTTPDDDLEECLDKMEQYRVRRLPVVDDEGVCVGMISQADIALHCRPELAGELVQEVSHITEYASAVH